MPGAQTMTITDDGFSIGVPVRVDWYDYGTESQRAFREHIDEHGLPGYDVLDEGYSDRHRANYRHCTGIVVPIRAFEQPIGGFDEGVWPYVDVRPATEAEARHLLADEARDARIRELANRFKRITGELNAARRWAADPVLAHVDVSDVPADRYREEIREQELQRIREYRHIAQLDGYCLIAGPNGGSSPAIVYPDPDRGIVWLRNQTFNRLWVYDLTDELAEIVNELIPLLPLHINATDSRTFSRDEVAQLWGIAPDSVRSTMRRYNVEAVSRTRAGQAEYPRTLVLSAHREHQRTGRGSWRTRRRRTN